MYHHLHMCVNMQNGVASHGTDGIVMAAALASCVIMANSCA